MAKYDDWRGKKAALYLRRSHGEKGTTKDQLTRIRPVIDEMIENGYIVFDYDTDVFDEGEHESGFEFDRERFDDLMTKVDDGEYQVLIAEKMNRFARDSLVLGDNAGRQLKAGLELYSINADSIFSYEDVDSKMTAVILMEVGGREKASEALSGDIGARGRKKKTVTGVSRDIRGSTIEKGSMTSPEMDWYRILRGELDMREALGALVNLPRYPKGHRWAGTPKGQKELDKMLGLSAGWSRNWWRRALDMQEAGVLDEWLDTIEAIRDYMLTLGKSAGPIIGYTMREEGPKKGTWRMQMDNAKPEVQRLLYSTRAWRRYPMGVNITGTITFVQHPKPLDIGIEALANTTDARTLKGWDVESTDLTRTQINRLLPTQQQLRGK